jgi:spore coat polysaccharide biosynthesis protein SpsF
MYNGKNLKIVATIEARMTSSRLPGKVLLPIGGVPALEMLITRLRRSKYLDGICVATTVNEDDEPIVQLTERLGVSNFRGSESDVLSRVLGAARSMSADIIVEITGDCPFVDPLLVDRAVEEFFTHEVDYASNTITATYANGFDVQVFPTAILAEVDSLTQDPVDRTHVSYYIYMHPEKYRLHNWVADAESHGPELRMTLDEDSDYQALQSVAAALLPIDPNFSAKDVTQYLRVHPEVVALNANVRQKEANEL